MKKTQRRSISGWVIKTMFKFFLVLVSLSLFQVAVLKYLDPPFTVNMVWERLCHEFFDAPYVVPTHEWQDLSTISPHLRQAVIAAEDQRFLTHHGFDLKEIKVVIKDMLAGKNFRDASTISMQAAQSLFLPAIRNPVQKVAEAWYTVLIELLWDKARILEIYLNTVDWGAGIVGAQAGARLYFDTDAYTLTPQQAALMAAALSSPHKWSPTDPSPYLKKRQQRILADMSMMPVLYK